MTHATTALLLTAPIAVPLAASAAHAATGLRGVRPYRRTHAPRHSAALAHKPPPPRTPAEPARTTGSGTAAGGPVTLTGGPPGAPPGPPPFAGDGPAPAPLFATGHDAPARPAGTWLGLVSPATILFCGAALAATVPDRGPVTAYGRLLRADALTVWLLLAVGAVAALACAAGPAHLAHERADAGAARRYNLLVQAFLAAMSAAVLAANLGVLWIAIEATTIVTAFLVGHRRTKASVEAAWKYVVICSAGIALAFLGTVLLYYAARQAGISEASALDWPTLAAHADRLDPAVTRLAMSLIVLGFGAKAGLAPLHAWLPDAHSQAPAPVSALMSGVLLSVAFAGLLRYKVIADAALGAGWTRTLLAGAALLTLALAAVLLLAQRDYKRMLAYSSMEHMSLIALGTAIGTPLAVSASLLHIAGHGLAKTVAFCASGHILRIRRSTRIGRVRGLLAEAPALGTTFGLSVVALLGLPPFSLFASELGLARAGFTAGHGKVVAVALILTLASFAALVTRTARMVLGPPPEPEAVADGPVRLGPAAAAPLVTGLVAAAALGVATGPLTRLLSAAGEIIGRH